LSPRRARPAEVRADVGVLATPRVPGSHALLEHRDVLVVRHGSHPEGFEKNDAAVVGGSERSDHCFKDNLARAARDRWPTHSYAATREAAITAFAKCWRRE